jgi:hypothetical protein
MDTIAMLVNARSEFIWGIKFGNYQCVYSIILLFIYIINYLSIKTIHDLLIS